jgi:arylsulfatase A-like enzyme
MRRPNVLLIYTDQQRWDTIAAGGHPLVKTPNLDRLAGEGVLFNNCFANHPVCMPSRQSMLSGRYGETVGCVWNGIEMPEDIPCIHNIIGPYGYHTANIGKLHFRNHSNRDHRLPHPTYGFDTMILSDEPGCYDDAYIKWVARHDPDAVEDCRCDTSPAHSYGPPRRVHPRGAKTPYVFDGPEHLTHTAFVAEETCDFIRRHAHEPFFCIAGIYAPHAPLNPPRRFVDMYDVGQMSPPHRNEGEGTDLSDEQWRKVKAYYYALISHVDDQVGRMLRTLDECGLAEDTVVLFTSDHGEMLGDHGVTGKCAPEDSSSRVPLVVRYPRRVAEPGAQPEAIIEAVDIAPTIVDWCGVQVPPYVQGRSFRTLCEGGDYEPRDSAYISLRIPLGEAVRALRTHEFLYVMPSPRTGYQGRPEQLFDLRGDPHQLTNVAGEDGYQEDLARLRHRLLERGFDVESQFPLRSAAY